MKTFTIETVEVWKATYVVKANTKEEALQLFKHDEDDDYFKCSEMETQYVVTAKAVKV